MQVLTNSTNPNAINFLRKGFFDTNIKTYCSVGFERAKLIGEYLESLVNDDGEFHWSRNVKVKSVEANLPGCQDIRYKQLVLISYFFY